MSEIKESKPFIYICSLARTGSTVLAEALTKYPYSFIFRETLLTVEKFNIKQQDELYFSSLGLNMEKIYREWESCLTKNSVFECFYSNLMISFLQHFQQLGIKEIYHTHWRKLFEVIPNIKVIITSRDPRDIYLSLIEMRSHYKDEGWRWRNLELSEMADILMKEFETQKEIASTVDVLIVKYEELCNNYDLLTNIKTYVESSIPVVGDIGIFNSKNPNRVYEYLKHTNKISLKSVNRWKTESDKKALENAYKFAELMSDYRKFFGY